MFVRIEASEAEKLALVLDSVECDLVGLQHRVYRVRQALERLAGKPCGYQYTEPNERGGAQDDATSDLLAALKLAVSVMTDADLDEADDDDEGRIALLQARTAIAKAEGKAVTP